MLDFKSILFGKSSWRKFNFIRFPLFKFRPWLPGLIPYLVHPKHPQQGYLFRLYPANSIVVKSNVFVKRVRTKKFFLLQNEIIRD